MILGTYDYHLLLDEPLGLSALAIEGKMALPFSDAETCPKHFLTFDRLSQPHKAEKSKHAEIGDA